MATATYRGNGEVPEPLRVAVEKVLKVAASGSEPSSGRRGRARG